jgi:hypothetical protein
MTTRLNRYEVIRAKAARISLWWIAAVNVLQVLRTANTFVL